MKVKLTEEELKARDRASVAKWRADNPEKIKANAAKWRADNPEKMKAKDAKKLLCRGTNLRPSDIPQELIDLKLRQIQMKQVMYANS